MKNYPSTTQYLRHFALIVVFASIVMIPSLYQGVTSGSDFTHHLQLANIVHDSVVSGEIYPSWAPHANDGYGDVTIRFYPPLSYYFLTFGYILTGDWYYGCFSTFFIIFLVGGIGAYLWMKEGFSGDKPLYAAAFYIFAPYHVAQIYNYFLYAEFAATAIIPFCFLFMTRVCRRGRRSDALGLSISYALLIATHLPQTVICSIILGIYTLLLLKKENILKTLLIAAASVIAAFAASSFYWIKMITEMKWVNLSNPDFYAGTYNYYTNFLLNPQNIINFSTDEFCRWIVEMMLFAVILISIPSIIFFIRERKSIPGFSVAIALVFLFSIFMTSQFSSFLWDNLSFLQKLQFPWRWLSIVSLSGALFATNGISRCVEIMKTGRNNLMTIGLGFILMFFVFTTFFLIKQASYLPRAEFDKQISSLETREFDRFWWIRSAKPEATSIKDKLTIQNRRAEVVNWDSAERNFDISAGDDSVLRVATFYYPYWRATANGNSVKVEPAEDGSILIPVSKEESHIKLYFEEPFFVRIAGLTSLSIWLLYAFIAGILFYKKSFSYNSAQPLEAL